jgi:protein NrfC
MTRVKDEKSVTDQAEKKKLSRRDFLTVGGAAIAGSALAAYSPKKAEALPQEEYAPSTRYLVYDSAHCAGCYGCMIACSLVHEGEVNLSLSRIQVHRSVLDEYPLDIQHKVCRQCPTPLCVENCPTGACHISAENGNIRMIDADKCIGCKTCIESCPVIDPYGIITREKPRNAICARTRPILTKKAALRAHRPVWKLVPQTL